MFDCSLSSSTVRRIIILLALALLIVTAYWPVTRAGFITYDDPLYLTENPQVRAGVSLPGIAWAFTTFHAFNWHPLTWLAHMAVAQLFGMSSLAHHLFSLLLHLLGALLLFIALRGMTGATWPAAFTGALFAVHPLHVESVAWASEVKDVLAGFCFMLTLLAYLRYLRKPSAGRSLAVIACGALGLLAKAMLVTLPFILLLLDRWPLGRARSLPGRDGRPTPGPWPRLAMEKIPLFLLAGGAGLLTWLAQSRGAVTGLEAIPLRDRLANALLSYAAYLGKTIWPRHLALFYPHPLGHWRGWQVAAAGALILVFTAAALAAGRRRPYLAVGWFWYLGMLVPVIGLVQVGLQGMADRYTYLPLIGPFLALAWWMTDLATTRPRRIIAVLAGGAAVAALMVPARIQAGYWHDDFSLFGHDVAAVPGNWVGHVNLGLSYYFRQDYDPAAEHFRIALGINPHYAKGHFYLGNVLRAQGKLEEAAARYREAVRQNPSYAEALTNLGLTYIDLGKASAAAEVLAEAVRVRPDYAKARFNLGDLLLEQGRLAEAAAQYREGVKLRPDYPEGWGSLGLALHRAGRMAEAMEAYRRRVELDPSSAAALNDLGAVLFQSGKLEEAGAAFREALRLDPSQADARLNLQLVRERLARGGAGAP